MKRGRRCRRAALSGALLAALWLAPGVWGCGGERASNVVIAVFDTTRYDDWSSFGGSGREVPTTPVLDRIAAGGQRFRNARSLYTWTVPSHVSLFTGRAVADSPMGAEPRFDHAAHSIFKILGDHGYRTYSFSGNKNIEPQNVEALAPVHVSEPELQRRMARTELTAILASYGEFTGPAEDLPRLVRRWHERNVRMVSASAENVNAAALAAMGIHAHDHAARPYLLFVNYNDAHDPYFPVGPWGDGLRVSDESSFNGNIGDPRRRRREVGAHGRVLSLSAEGLSEADIARARELHLRELSYADHHFGELLAGLDSLGLLDDTVIVATADHGEAFGEQGRMSHSGEPMDVLVHVPLVIRLPERGLEPAVIDAAVDLRDVKPTLLDYLGIDDPGSTGRSLLPVMLDPGAALAPPLVEPTRPELQDAAGGLVPGQSPETERNLRRELEALGYIE